MKASLYKVPIIEKPFNAAITLPGSKSIALRQLALAAIADGRSVIRGVPPCDDTDAMMDCLERLGVRLTRQADAIELFGPMDFGERRIELDARMSGASTRLLLALAALRRGATLIDGHASLRARTNAPLLEVLARYGCSVASNDGCLPVTIRGPFAPPAAFEIDGSLSSQYITALLSAAPHYAKTTAQIVNIAGSLVSKPYIDITLNELEKRGIQATWTGARQLTIVTQPVATGAFAIEGDATAATYFAALATLHGGEVTLTNLGCDTVQGDYAFLDLMGELGATVSKNGSTHIVGPAAMNPLAPHDLTAMPDAALTLIAMAPLLPGATRINGLSSLHHKECDRLECPATELRALGVTVETEEDAITIAPMAPAAMASHTLNTYHDHRMAMAFSVIGSVSPNLSIDDKAVVNKTYPDYWRDYETLLS